MKIKTDNKTRYTNEPTKTKTTEVRQDHDQKNITIIMLKTTKMIKIVGNLHKDGEKH